MFKKIDKSKPNWRDERSDFWNKLCDIGRGVGATGRDVGRTLGPIIGQTIGALIDRLIPIAIQVVTEMVVDIGETGIQFISGAIKEIDLEDISGLNKFQLVKEELVAWLEEQEKDIPNWKVDEYIQYIFGSLRRGGNI